MWVACELDVALWGWETRELRTNPAHQLPQAYRSTTRHEWMAGLKVKKMASVGIKQGCKPAPAAELSGGGDNATATVAYHHMA